MAADLGKDAYDATTNSVAVTLPSGIDATKEATVLVLNKGVKLTDALTDGDILYVNQETGGDFDGETADAETLKLLGTEALADGTYTVAIGYYNTAGTFAIQEDTFTLGDAAAATHEVLMGDVTGEGKVNSTDAQQILRHAIQKTDWSGNEKISADDQKIAADVTADGKVNSTDAQQVLKHSIAGTSNSKTAQTAVVNDADGTVVEYK
jgi:hypothetical protein